MNALDYETRLREADRNIAVARETERQARAEIAGTNESAAQARQELLRTALAELSDAETRIAMAGEDLRKAGRRAGTMKLTAPVAGTVQQLKLATIGGVVQPAEALMTIVPAAPRSPAAEPLQAIVGLRLAVRMHPVTAT